MDSAVHLYLAAEWDVPAPSFQRMFTLRGHQDWVRSVSVHRPHQTHFVSCMAIDVALVMHSLNPCAMPPEGRLSRKGPTPGGQGVWPASQPAAYFPLRGGIIQSNSPIDPQRPQANAWSLSDAIYPPGGGGGSAETGWKLEGLFMLVDPHAQGWGRWWNFKAVLGG